MKNQVSNNNNTNAKIFGTVTNAPEIKVTASGKRKAGCRLVSYEKVTGEDGVVKNNKVWRNIIAWGSTADFLQRNFTPGRKVTIECTERNASYTDQNGKLKNIHEFNVDRVLHLGEVKPTVLKSGTDC